MKSISTTTITITSLLYATRIAVQSSSPIRNWSANPKGSIDERSSSPSFTSPRKTTRPKYYENQEEEEYYSANNNENGDGSIPSSIKGLGREFELFSGNVLDRTPQKASPGPRGGSTENNNQALPVDNDNVSASTTYTTGRVGGSNRGRSRRSSRSGSRRKSTYAESSPQSQRARASHFQNPFSSLLTWVSDNQSSIPRIQVKVEPNTTLKLRKRFRPLFKTLVTLGADFNTQRGVWQFKSSWEDSIIGGRLMLAGRELQLSKTWLLSVGKFLFEFLKNISKVVTALNISLFFPLRFMYDHNCKMSNKLYFIYRSS